MARRASIFWGRTRRPSRPSNIAPSWTRWRSGADGVFRGAFCYADLEGMQPADALEFSNAMAALNFERE
jgi:sugar/nucleoside kinase (ribokinase family)